MPLHITPATKSVKVQPKNKNELYTLIKKELQQQGPDADLNFIDTYLITDMSYLFVNLDIRNVKIDKWVVSNVENMTYMFYDCKNFNCDLSN